MNSFTLRVPDRKRLLAMLLLAAVYFITARIGLSLYSVNNFAALIWPPTGIAFAALLLYGRDLWPGVAVAAFLVNISIGGTIVPSLAVALGNTLEACLGVWTLQRFGFANSFGTLRAALLFCAVALVAPMLSATIGVEGLSFAGLIPQIAVNRTWMAWWSGDVVGALVFAPLILSWFGKARSYLFVSTLELYAVLLATIITSLFIFWAPGDAERLYLMIIPLAWASVRIGARGKTFMVFITAVIAAGGTLAGNGPLGVQTVATGLMSLQLFIAVVAIVFLVVASVVEEDARTKVELETYVNELEETIQNNHGNPQPLAHESRKKSLSKL